MDREHMNPAQVLMHSLVTPLMDAAGHGLRELQAAGFDRMDLAIKQAESELDHMIRMLVYSGQVATAGVRDVRELYDLEVRIKVLETDEGKQFAIGVLMPNVMRILREQDDPNAN